MRLAVAIKAAKCAFAVLLILNSSFAISQLNADFVADQSGGCSPLAVTFTNKTTGASPAATYQWDLGNGNTSAITNPGGTYKDEKTYTVTLTVKDGTQTSTKTLQIVVYKKPVVDFSTSIMKGCAPLPVNFTANATSGDGTITSYSWDFGDGQTSTTTTAQTSHTYTFATKATAGLTVKNSYGCYNTLQKPDLVDVQATIRPVFAPDKTTVCNIADAVKFTNTSTGPADMTYVWDFGDGNTSTTQSPSYTYNKKGAFTAKLTINSASGCSASTTSILNVANFTTDFDLPSLVCQNTYTTINSKSSPTPSNSTWFIDNNAYSYNTSFLNAYFSTPGTHSIKLTNTYGTCQESLSKDVIVKAPPVLDGFVANLGGTCGAPVTVQFKDTSTSAVKWLWNFNAPYSSATSTIKEPSYTYTSETSYQVQLTITNAEGCTTTRTKYLNITKPNVYISITKSNSTSSSSGCTNLTVTFAANPATDIVDYVWDFGDGSTATTANPEHTFGKVGTYNIKLNFTTANGCKGIAYFNNTITVYEKPKVDFTAPTTVCGNTPVVFTVTSATNNYGLSWYWNFGDNGNTYYNQYNVTHQYFKDTTYTVTLIASNYGCADTVTKTNYIKVLPPFPKISTVTNTCIGTRGLVTFVDASKKSLGGTWDFGDGTTTPYVPGQSPVSHTYTKTGTYKVVLTTTNDQCSVRDSATAYVLLKQSPALTATQTEICGSDKLNIQINNFELNPYPYNYYYYSHYYISKVQYGDGTSYTGSPYNTNSYWTNVYNGTIDQFANGQKDIRAITTSAYFGCTDTTNYIPLKIKGPVVKFSIDNNNLCYKSPNLFTDSSKGTNNVAITKWDWSYGDNTTQSLTSGGKVSHTYTHPGSYYVSLKVTDAEGCSATTASYTNNVQVNGPKALFSYNPTSVSPNTTVYFYNNTNNYNSYNTQYSWSFGDGSASTTTYSPSHTYTAFGTDTVKLIAKNTSTGCTDTAVQVISVKNFSASFTYTSSYINNNSCPPVIVRFTNTSLNATSVSWNFGDGGKADNQNNPSHTYYKPGVYYVAIYVTGANGLKDSTVDSITIKGPYAKIKSDVIQGCNGQTVTFNAEVKNATSYTWDFADGTLKQTQDTFAVHQYLTAGVYTPSLILKDGGGCSATSEMADKIIIDTLNVQVSHAPSRICDSAQVFFTPTIKSLAADQLQQPLKYHWDFGTGNLADTSDVKSPLFSFNKRIKFAVKLQVSSAYGCTKEAMDTIEVFQKPKSIITGPSEVCEAALAQFSGGSDVSNVHWKWNFNNGSTSSVQNPTSQLYNAPGNYDVVLIIDNVGCYDTTISKLTVHAKPVINLSPKQTTVCLGKSIQLTANGGSTYLWSNTAGLNNYTIANPTATPTKTSQYNVEVTNSFGCKNYDSSIVQVATPFKIKVSADTIVCIGKSAQLSATGASSFAWINNTAGLNSSQISNPIASPNITTTYTVVGYDAAQCFNDTAFVRVTVASYPTVSAGADVQVFGGSSVQLSATGSSDVTKWNWSPPDYLSCIGCQSPTALPKRDISYVVTGTNNSGCATSDTVSIQLLCDQSHVYIPTSFTPNSDYKNDVFYIKGSGVKLIKFLKVFDRFGGVVFETGSFNINDPSSGWNGNFNGYPVSTGAYVYFTEMVCESGETFSFKGTVMLIR